MSSIQPSFQPQPFGHRETFDPGAAWRRGFGRKVRWVIAWSALLALAVVTFMGSEGMDPTTAQPQAQTEAQTQESADPVPFDGRGKWTGYAR